MPNTEKNIKSFPPTLKNRNLREISLLFEKRHYFLERLLPLTRLTTLHRRIKDESWNMLPLQKREKKKKMAKTKKKKKWEHEEETVLALKS
ncbi:hypothetical protein CEXT_76171 [Caerostris extrusa]|uniref:Uncharacterized protein n=1 Tax=Caerostris extrusa TaxID=172846 RepID=A0AAV4P658_CAEEX|nr:hypothetical protein CEXT_76171 [Caerostris extrusa]